MALALVIHGLWFSGRSSSRRLVKGNKQDQELLASGEVGKVRIVSEEQSASEGGESTPGEDPRRQPPPSQVPDESLLARVQTSYELNVVAPHDSPFKGEEIREFCDRYGFTRGTHNIFHVYEYPEQRQNEVFRVCSLKPPFYFPEDLNGYTTPAIALYMNLPDRGKAAPYFSAMRRAADFMVDAFGCGRVEDNFHQEMTPARLDEIALILRQFDEGGDHEA
ncbi:MAG: cell division protein ZipA C-terminal FtsZ-binding domain-containing protein [Succinivibrionaceae bacterium]|nr:cell division protein ZipA C-terminal FtsZ-binding domain-containing protein [Succinivibrionaceae bacterium]